MNCFRISKYDPSFRVDGAYLKEEWTDYSDIGKVFDGEIFTETRYLEVEQNYINCVIELLNTANVHQVDIIGRENMETTKWKKIFFIGIDALPELVRDILRNKCWCRLEGKNCYIHFGWDFYMYLGVNLSYDKVSSVCERYSLFCEEMDSPYSTNDDLLHRVFIWKDRVKCSIKKYLNR